MAKITLGKRPATIVRTVKAPLLDGTEGSMQVHYRYRTRQEWGELIDRRTAEARERNAAREEADRTARSLQQLKDGLGCGTQCGSCVPQLQRMVQASL